MTAGRPMISLMKMNTLMHHRKNRSQKTVQYHTEQLNEL